MQTEAVDKKCASKGIKTPLETLCGNLPEISSHNFLQKARG